MNGAPLPAGRIWKYMCDAVVAVLAVAAKNAPVVLILDDLHWAAKPTLLLLRHLLRFGERARVQVIGTYRSTDLDRSHPLAAMLADLHRSAGTADRLALSGLDEDDVTAYVADRLTLARFTLPGSIALEAGAIDVVALVGTARGAPA